VRAVPPELSVRLGSLDLRTPVVCGSGEHVMTAETIDAAVDAGAAAVVAKSANESAAARRQLASAEYAWLDERRQPTDPGAGASLLNRSGLVDEPFGSWIETLARCDARARRRDAYVAASLIPADEQVLPELAAQVEQAGLRWLELNVAAPHGEEAPEGAIRTDAELVRPVREAVSLPLTVKVRPDQVGAAVEAGADAVCLTTRALGFVPDPETRRPLLGTFAAIGGAWALPVTLRHVAKARARYGTELSIVGTNGARDGLDVVRFLLAGASAVQLTTVVMTDGPAALARAIAELEGYLAEQGVSAAELVGEAADAVLTYEEAAVERRH
jgi:dihydroorotate dehydrogenase